jgi:hypothetical protein
MHVSNGLNICMFHLDSTYACVTWTEHLHISLRLNICMCQMVNSSEVS